MIFVRQWIILGRANRSIKRGSLTDDRGVKNKHCALKSQWYGVITPLSLFPCFSHNFVFSSSHFLCVLENPPPTLLLREILLPPLESVLIPIFLDFPIISCFYQAIFFLGYLKTLLLHLGEIQLPRGVCDAPTVNLSAPNAATSSTFNVARNEDDKNWSGLQGDLSCQQVLGQGTKKDRVWVPVVLVQHSMMPLIP